MNSSKNFYESPAPFSLLFRLDIMPVPLTASASLWQTDSADYMATTNGGWRRTLAFHLSTSLRRIAQTETQDSVGWAAGHSPPFRSHIGARGYRGIHRPLVGKGR